LENIPKKACEIAVACNVFTLECFWDKNENRIR